MMIRNRNKKAYNNRQNLGIYIHWPFCLAKCPYCDFNSHVREKINHQLWLESYVKEIDYFAELIKNSQINSIFFGGGTPSLMSAEIVDVIINKLAKLGTFNDEIEITLEANPSSVEVIRFQDFKFAGVNRLSIGIQALNDVDLAFLGRKHNTEEAIKAIEIAQKLFKNYSFDLIYARPKQTIESWQRELEYALTLAGGHLSLYQLTIEKGTSFYRSHRLGQFTLPDEDLSANMYLLTRELTEKYGLLSYEVSNYAKFGQECKHNLTYWRYENYLGIGPGAHSRINGQAITMVYNPENWLTQVSTSGQAIQSNYTLSCEEKLDELLLMGLRIKEGISLKKFNAIFNKSIEELLNLNSLEYLCNEQYLTINNTHLSATYKGFLLLNKIIALLKQ